MNYEESDAVDLANAVRTKKVSARELLEAAIKRAEKWNPRLNAIVIEMHELARKRADEQDAGEPQGPFHGVPFLMKDLGTAYSGVPLRGGGRLYKNFVPDFDGELARRYKAAGLITFGKTNTPEWGILPFTEPDLYGPCDNPWKAGHTVGGSSGGSAAAVAARIVPMAHGGDGGGSLRIPASCCGVFGFKPSRAVTPAGPDYSELLHGAAVEHVITRTVRDSAAALDATAGPEDTSPYFATHRSRPFLDEIALPPPRLRIAVTTRPLLPARPVDPEVADATMRTARMLEDLGHHVVEARPEFDSVNFARSFFLLFCATTAGELLYAERYFRRPVTQKDVERTTWLAGMVGRARSAGDFSLALRDLATTSRAFLRFFRDYDAILTPTIAQLPLKHGALVPGLAERLLEETVVRSDVTSLLKAPGVVDRVVDRAYDFSPFTMIANAGGFPSMSVPLHQSRDGLPIGSMFTGAVGRDGMLLSLARQLEQAHDWNVKPWPG